MSEFDDFSLREALSQFHTDVLAAAPPQDIAGVRAIARRRRATRSTAIGVAAALVLVTPVAAYAFVGRPDSGPPAMQPSVSASPSESPSESPSAVPSATPSAPDGKISLKDLGNATLDIPDWPAGGMQCATKRQKFTKGETAAGDGFKAHMMINKVAYADVDHDGAQETIALLSCLIQGADEQVAVFDRNAAGDIVTLGQVLTQDTSIQNMFDVRGEADGSVSVEVGDIHTCCGVGPNQAFHQWRRYTWDGQRFGQIAGPTEFPKRADLVVTAPDVRLGPLANGVRQGTVTVTVRNVGPATARIGGPVTAVGMELQVSPTFVDQPANVDTTTNLGNCVSSEPPYGIVGKDLTCSGLKLLAPGQSATFTFQLTSPQANDQVIPTAPNDNATWGVTIRAKAADGALVVDANGRNNFVRFKVSRVD